MAESKTAVVAALVGNGALAVLKGTSAAFTGSAAMLAETFHSIADTANEALLLLGIRIAARPADDDHPFGHGKAVYFWAFVVSIMLFTLGGAWSIWEALRHYLHPVSKQATLWAYGVLAAAFVFESISFGVASRSLNAVRGSRPILDYWQDSRDPALLTVLLEDSAALVALPIAASGLWLTSYTGNGVWDAAASAAIGVLLLSVAVVLAIENHSLLIGESAPRRTEQAIRAAVVGEPGVVDIRSLHTMHLGPNQILIVLGIHFAENLSARDIEDVVARLECRVTDALRGMTDARLIVIEPTPSAGGKQTKKFLPGKCYAR